MVDNRTDGHDEQSSHPDWDVEPARTEDSEHTQDSERTGATAAAQVAEHDRVVDEPVYRDDHAERVGNDVHDERADARVVVPAPHRQMGDARASPALTGTGGDRDGARDDREVDPARAPAIVVDGVVHVAIHVHVDIDMAEHLRHP